MLHVAHSDWWVIQLVHFVHCSLFIYIVELGIKSDSNTTKGRHLSVYEEYFEEDFIKHTERFYATESVTFLANNPMTEYLKRVC